MVVVVLADGVIRYLRSRILSWEGARFDHGEGMRALSHILDLDTAEVDFRTKGYYLDKVHALEQIQEFYSGQSILIMIDFPFVVLFLIVIAVITGPLVLVPIVLLGVFLGVCRT